MLASSGFVSGHGFSRAEYDELKKGFSPSAVFEVCQ